MSQLTKYAWDQDLKCSLRDVSGGFDDTIFLVIDETRSSVLDTVTVSHFAPDSSYSLRFTDLFDIIPGLKFLKKQNSLLVVLQPSTSSSTPKEVQEMFPYDDL